MFYYFFCLSGPSRPCSSTKTIPHTHSHSHTLQLSVIKNQSCQTPAGHWSQRSSLSLSLSLFPVQSLPVDALSSVWFPPNGRLPRRDLFHYICLISFLFFFRINTFFFSNETKDRLWTIIPFSQILFTPLMTACLSYSLPLKTSFVGVEPPVILCLQGIFLNAICILR